MSSTIITAIRGRRVWDSRGRPTVEAEITLAGGATGRAIAPAGASTGSGEALDKRDGGSAFGGYDVTAAVDAVNRELAPALLGMDARAMGGGDEFAHEVWAFEEFSRRAHFRNGDGEVHRISVGSGNHGSKGNC